MFTFIYGYRSNHKKKVLFSNFRHRNTTKWSDLEQKEARKVFSILGCQNKTYFSEDAAEDLINGNLSTEFFSNAKLNQMRKEMDFCKHQMRSIDLLFGQPFREPFGTNTTPDISCLHLELQQPMHEIVHGLGGISLGRMEGNIGSLGTTTLEDLPAPPSWGWPVWAT